MTTIGINEAFFLSFLIGKSERKQTETELNGAGEKFTINEYKKAPAMLEVLVKVKNIKDANTIINNLK